MTSSSISAPDDRSDASSGSTKYVIGKGLARRIEEMPCIKETKSFAWVEQQQFQLHGCGSPRIKQIRKAGRVFDTWEEAHAELLARAGGELQRARRTFELARSYAGNIKGMKPPTA